MLKITLMLTALLLSMSSLIAQAAPILYFDFDSDTLMDTGTTAATGSSVTASLYITGIDDIHGGLTSWGSEISFDNTLVSANNFSIDPTWFRHGIDNNIDNTAGTVELFASTFSGQTGTLKLADIVFDTLDAGTATLSTAELFPGDLSFVGFSGADTHDYDAEVIYSTAGIEITAVPIPAVALLFMSGLSVLFGCACKRPTMA